jgi:hypothetical protein
MSIHLLLPYDVGRTADSDDVLLAFLQSTYKAAATCGKWNRDRERQWESITWSLDYCQCGHSLYDHSAVIGGAVTLE